MHSRFGPRMRALAGFPLRAGAFAKFCAGLGQRKPDGGEREPHAPEEQRISAVCSPVLSALALPRGAPPRFMFPRDRRTRPIHRPRGCRAQDRRSLFSDFFRGGIPPNFSASRLMPASAASLANLVTDSGGPCCPLCRGGSAFAVVFDNGAMAGLVNMTFQPREHFAALRGGGEQTCGGRHRSQTRFGAPARIVAERNGLAQQGADIAEVAFECGRGVLCRGFGLVCHAHSIMHFEARGLSLLCKSVVQRIVRCLEIDSVRSSHAKSSSPKVRREPVIRGISRIPDLRPPPFAQLSWPAVAGHDTG